MVAGVQSVPDLDGRHRRPAEHDGLPDCEVAAGVELEQADGRVGLSEGRASDIEHVVEALDLDRPVDAEVGPGARGQRTVERDFDVNGAVLHRRINAGDAARYDTIAGIDGDDLSGRDVLGLGLGDLEDGLELPGLGDFARIWPGTTH